MDLCICIWLVLLVSVISQCVAIEYYVKPTHFNNITCPGQPCLTIKEYTKNVAHYIKSNTVFTFLPGKHIVFRPIVIRDVENISITAISVKSDTIITTQLSCQNEKCENDSVMHLHYPHSAEPPYYLKSDMICCSVIRLINVSHAILSGMSIELNSANNSSGVTGITIQKSCHVYIQMNIYCFQMCNSICRCGFLAHESSHLFSMEFKPVTSTMG